METAEAILQDKSADLVAFGRGFLANPDFVKRIEKNGPCNDVDLNTCPGRKDYTDNSLKKSKQ
jgi:N-ethylmaleimide reductase